MQEISRIEVLFHKVNADHIHKIFAATHLKLTEDLIHSKIEEINTRKRDALSFFKKHQDKNVETSEKGKGLYRS